MSETGVLASIFSGCTGKIEIRPLPPSPDRPPAFFDDPEGAEQYAASVDGVVDVYFGAGTRMRDSGTKDDVQELPGLWADCDDQASVDALAGFLPPTLTVETSPGRCQAWWLFKEPLLLETLEIIGTVESVLRNIARRLQSDPSVAEIARVMRVPGTLNLKRQARGRILKSDGPHYDLSDFLIIGLEDQKTANVSGNGHDPSHDNWVTAALAGVPEGQRTRTCTRLAGYFLRKVPPDIVRGILEGYGQRCTPPLTPAEVDTVILGVTRTANRETPGAVVQPSTFESLQATIKTYLLLADPHLVDVVGGALVANLFKSDPLWLLLVQPPSSAKTEILEGASGIPAVFPLSDLTASTLLSGTGKKNADSAGVEPSLLPHIDGRIVMMKDFGTVLSMHRDKRQEILAQLREVYDGHYTKRWGTGKQLDWKGHVGFIGGVTTAIDTHYSALAMLGERFTLYRALAPDRKSVAARAVGNMQRSNAKKMRADIAAAFKGWHDSLTIPSLEDVTCSESIKQSICDLADLTAHVRTSVARDGYTRLILTRPEAEGPARLARQFYLLAAGIAVAHGRTTVQEHELVVIRRVAASTMPAQRLDALKATFERPADAWVKTRDLAGDMAYPSSTAKEILEDLVALGLVEQRLEEKSDQDGQDQPDGRRDTRPYAWRLKEKTRSLLKVSSVLPGEAQGDLT